MPFLCNKAKHPADRVNVHTHTHTDVAKAGHGLPCWLESQPRLCYECSPTRHHGQSGGHLHARPRKSRRSQRARAQYLFYGQRCATLWCYGQSGGHCNARPSDDPNDQGLGIFSTDKGARLHGVMAKVGATAMPDPQTIPKIKGSAPFLQTKVRGFVALWPNWGPLQCQTL